MRIKSVLKHSAQALAEGSIIALLVAGLMAGSVFAAKPAAGSGGGGKHGGGGSTGGSGSVVLVMSTDANANGAPNWADQITYTVSTASTVYPYVSTTCTQNGILVLSTSAGWFASYAWPSARIVPLQTDRWTGGAASCTAKLYSMDSGSQSVLSTITFNAAG